MYCILLAGSWLRRQQHGQLTLITHEQSSHPPKPLSPLDLVRLSARPNHDPRTLLALFHHPLQFPSLTLQPHPPPLRPIRRPHVHRPASPEMRRNRRVDEHHAVERGLAGRREGCRSLLGLVPSREDA